MSWPARRPARNPTGPPVPPPAPVPGCLPSRRRRGARRDAGPAAVGYLAPHPVSPGCDLHRDLPARDRRPAVPHAVGHQLGSLIHEYAQVPQGDRTSGTHRHPSRCAGHCRRKARPRAVPPRPPRMPRAEHPARERAGDPRPPASATVFRTAPVISTTALRPHRPGGSAPSRRAGAHGDARPTQRRGSSRDTPPARSVAVREMPTVHTDRRNCAHRPS